MEEYWRKSDFDSFLINMVEASINDINWRKQILYSLKAGGKRFRPALCCLCGETLQIDQNSLFTIASAVELLHTASLIHDDLPEIDDDDYRRGQLSHHRQFSHGTAVVAADFIFFFAFELITRLNSTTLSRYFSRCSQDLAYGEYIDIKMEKSSEISQETLEKMYEYKTARLIEFSMTAPAVLTKKTAQHIQHLQIAGQNMGIAFQILDDLKGIEGRFEDIGKTPGKDIVNNKKTIPQILGIKASKELVFQKKQKCLEQLKFIKTIDGSDYQRVVDFLSIIWEKIEIS
mgnify:CR=1 FL=1